MTELTDGSARKNIDIGQLAAAIGALSAAALFVAANSTYSYARGLSSSLLFPAQIMTLRTSTDIFPGIVSQNTVTFIAILIAGFFAFREHRGKKSKVLAYLGVLVVLLVVGEIWDEHTKIYTRVLIVASFAAPAFVGYAYHAFRDDHRAGPLIVGLMIFGAFAVNNSMLYQQGYAKGKQIAISPESETPIAEHGLANIKTRDFPIIHLKTKEALELSATAQASPDGYLYLSTRQCFLRLIAYDDANYYIIQNNGGSIQSMAVRKEAVREIIFVNAL